MGVGPVPATEKALKRAGLKLSDIDLAIEAPGFIRHRNAHEKLDREPVIQMPGMLPLTPQAGDSRRTAFLARIICLFVLCGVGMACVPAARAEDGYDLWLRYRAVEAGRAQAHPPYVTQLVAGTTTPTQAATRTELMRGLEGLLGAAPAAAENVTRDGALDGEPGVVVATI